MLLGGARAEAMSDLLSTLQKFAGGREGCFESAATKVDAVAVCHEVRSVAASAIETLCVTFKVLNQRQPPGDTRERYLAPGEQLSLKSLQLDSVVLMSVWAVAADGASPEQRGAPRPCGEVRIPIRYLVTKCEATLYHTWVALDSPGLNDSVASIGLLDGHQDDGEAFAQAMNNAPRQLLQPKACISLCKVDSLGLTGQVEWGPDVPRDQRIARWGPLLRSQQQHVMLCALRQLQEDQANQEARGTAPATASGPLEDLQRRTDWQAADLEALREQLRSRKAAFSPAPRSRGAGAGQSEELRSELELEARLDRELAELREDLAKTGEEANAKIDAANARIRTLRQERDDAVKDVECETAALQQLRSAMASTLAQKALLEEQTSALTRIVDDLHQACTGAGLELTSAARRSIDSLRSLRFP